MHAIGYNALRVVAVMLYFSLLVLKAMTVGPGVPARVSPVEEMIVLVGLAGGMWLELLAAEKMGNALGPKTHQAMTVGLGVACYLLWRGCYNATQDLRGGNVRIVWVVYTVWMIGVNYLWWTSLTHLLHTTPTSAPRLAPLGKMAAKIVAEVELHDQDCESLLNLSHFHHQY